MHNSILKFFEIRLAQTDETFIKPPTKKVFPGDHQKKKRHPS